ncbi:COG4315 family predicted lipoprotein [Tengunoibacter tsumagoiensis]|uniref:Lipoprotein n=1 Tax=Tengunoibacter tsumagoiensis TaxID=2014871 RepID=A0A401ZVX2_9CHLR|nr:hypothetical protein [Tengunoibacter tsumagoiensis]GCE11051.1 lipoprotein [Tengunoibacter tsumagoiensis]
MTIKRFFWFLVVLCVISGGVVAVDIVYAGANQPDAGTWHVKPTPLNSTPTAPPTPSVQATASPVDDGNTLIHVAKVLIGKSTKTVLTTAVGYVLYYHTTDSATSICTGLCSNIWVPLVNSGYPTSTVPLPGVLSTVLNANGQQVTYDGHPLYTYTGDQKPGDVRGEGVDKVWFVVDINL